MEKLITGKFPPKKDQALSYSNSVAVKQILRTRDVLQLLGGISRSTFWRLRQNDPTFPAGKAITSRVSVWNRDEILNWMDSKSLNQNK